MNIYIQQQQKEQKKEKENVFTFKNFEGGPGYVSDLCSIPLAQVKKAWSGSVHTWSQSSYGKMWGGDRRISQKIMGQLA